MVLISLRANRRALASGATLTAAVVAVTTMAVLYEGYRTAEVELNDGGVWVTKSSDLLVGHLNFPSRVLDAGLRSSAPDYDVLQQGDTVLVHDRSSSTLAAVDPAAVALLGETALPAGAVVAAGGDVVAVLDGGDLYPVTVPSLGGFTLDGVDPLAELGSGAAVAVGDDGIVHAVSRADHEIVTFAVVDGGFAETSRSTLPELPRDADLRIAAIGDRAAVLDARTGVLYPPSGDPVEIDGGAGAELQQSSPSGDVILVATEHALVTVPGSGGEAAYEPAEAPGAPAAPVRLNGCSYAAWSGSAAYLRDCAGDAHDTSGVVDGARSDAELRYRVNRDVVVLNDVRNGGVWLVTQQMQLVENWDDVVPPPAQDAEQEETNEEDQQTLPERSDVNRDPIAVDDQYGVRPGRTAVLRVTENDSDPDGDLLEASVAGDLPPALEDAVPVLGGAALQVKVSPNATGTLTFGYGIDDGRGGTDEARVSLSVRPEGTNAAPELVKPQTVVVEAGASLEVDALQGWRDPDGDDLFLLGASTEGGDQVTYRSSGIVEFTASAHTPGITEVALVVSDGSEEAEGVLRVDVRPAGTLRPIANADRASTTAGTPVVLTPLANDTSPSGQPLRLAKHDQAAGATVVPDFAAGTLTFTAAAPGVYYLQYLVTDGPSQSAGLIRIDVLAGGASDRPPVAVRDTALLPAGRSTLVDVLANDSDPAGGVLVVQSVQVAPGSGISVEVLEHRIVRVTDASGLSSPVAFAYTVSNGTQSATGEVLVLPVPLPPTLRPPVTVDDRATVRAGDVVTVDVLANDSHPDGDTITLRPDLVAPVPDASQGDVFIAEGKLRFRASESPGTVYATYEVEDTQGNRTAGYVTIQVLARDDANNQAPRPLPLTARVIAGSSVRIPVPLDGIDPDGDSVELLGTADAPAKGRATVGDGWLTYEAYPGSRGTDTFGYVVRDRLGAVAEGAVVVGIAGPNYANQAPYAVKDAVSVRPGRAVAVAVLANDSDPDGDRIGLVADALEVADGLEAETVRDRVVVTAPATPGDYTVQYRIADALGAEAVGSLLVTVDPEAPLRAPIARDDRASALDAAGERTVRIDLLANDEDPDGVASDLDVDLVADTVRLLAGGIAEVQLLPEAQVLTYTVTDRDGLRASAFVRVPGSDEVVPTLAIDEPLEVASGESLRIALADVVRVRAERTPRVATADSATAAHADGTPLVVDERTLAYTSAPGYYGPDAVGVLVTDGSGPDDPTARQAYVSVPIVVVPTSNVSPTLQNATVPVAPGEDAVVLDLAKLSIDPDRGDLDRLAYRVVGDVPSGFGAEVDGSRLRVRAEAEAARGATAAITVEVTDGTSTPTTGTVSLVVVASQRPLAVVNDDAVPDARQGAEVAVDVLANDVSPFPGEPLDLRAARVDSGTGTVRIDGRKVVVTPDRAFVGTMIASYRVADATGAPEREVEGRIVLTVQGVPAAPGTPTVTSVQDRTVVLSWTPPANNGAPITGYTVSVSSGGERSCASTTCTIDGLANDVEVTFTVTATNRVGESAPSPTSAPARPDARPDTPAPPTLAFGDGRLDVAWAPPASRGSAVASYTLEISPAPAAGPIQKAGVTGTSLTWEGLENGVAYQVRVRAHNRAPEPSEWSTYSASMIPAGVPDAPGQPTSTPSTPVGAQAQIAVAWAPPASTHGDAVADYTLTVKRGGSVVTTLVVTGTSQNVTVDTSETDYAFSVTARNKAGSSSPSSDSAPRRAANAPAAPATVTATPGDGSLAVAFTPGALNGNRAGELTWNYRLSTGAQGTLPAGGGSIGGLANGTSYAVSVWATSTVAGVAPGPETTSNAVVPFGKPIITLQAINRLDGGVEFRWNVNANGSGLTSQSHGVDGGGNGAYTQGGMGPDQTATLTVTYANAAGSSSSTWSGQSKPQAAWNVQVDNASSCLEDSDSTAVHYAPPNCTSRWVAAGSVQSATCWVTWSKKNVNGDRRWFRLTDGWYLSVYTTVGEAIPAGMPTC
ncbi:Ig-like domain-containing protein [Agromyces sp. MMS24-K17]|uniref:Ig-like domain-containing protein n=1 Tax=Agromyces sp. MMS24-K17 TaxID=3372850 RepID=UPI003753F156